MSSGVFEPSEALVEAEAVTTKESGRNWAQIGLGLAAAFVVISLYVISIWFAVVLVEGVA